MKPDIPRISIIIPTLNSASVLIPCLSSIKNQTYQRGKIDILVIDGGSIDNTLEIAKKFKCIILHNPLKTAESGKAIGIKKATGKYIALIDSDNILPTNNWLKNMIFPLENNPSIIGSEPWNYTYRPNGGFIERYAALTGVNDPYTLTVGNYDRKGYLHHGWTGLKIAIKNYKNFQLATLQFNHLLPTIGANGTFYRRDFLKRYFHSDYFFDIDVITSSLNVKHSSVLFAKIKLGIIHTFCESSIIKFYRKQLRRVTDLYTYRSLRRHTLINNNLKESIKFILYVILILPMFYDTFRGYLKKPDIAWFFHPLACVLTLYTYGVTSIKYYLGLLKPLNRQQWQQ